MQKLILPINNSRVTASYKNSAYRNKFGFTHYGCDIISVIGNTVVYGSGNGSVVDTGLDSVVGNVIVVSYPEAYNHLTDSYHDITVRYYHLDQITISPGATVTKDTVLGHYGNTGVLVMGKHLHIEVDKDTSFPLYSPTVRRSSFLKGTYLGAVDKDMTDPLQWLYAKTSDPDKQTYSTTNDAFINSENNILPTLV